MSYLCLDFVSKPFVIVSFIVDFQNNMIGSHWRDSLLEFFFWETHNLLN